MTQTPPSKHLIDIRHPQYSHDELYWDEWRECYDGGPLYVEHNLKAFDRESSVDFENRKFYTPIETPAAGAINDIRNSIFQRLRDVIRRDGSDAYIKAAAGEHGGVDNKGSSMQSFIGIDVLTELLIMGRVGIYIDMPRLYGESMADVGDARPYMYKYDVEDILSWAPRKPEEPGDFSAVLLRDRGVSYNQSLPWGGSLPNGEFTRFRYMWVNETTGLVNMKLYNQDEVPVDLDGSPMIEDGREIYELGLTRIPFIMPTIGNSLLKNVYKHQVALLNLGSSDVAYALKANFPFLVEQSDSRGVGSHLKRKVAEDGTTVTTENDDQGREIKAGTVHGRTYPMKANQPAFIHPSPEPLMASMKLQEKIEDSIRKNVNLAVQNKAGQRAISAEAMKLSDQGLEAGLSYIGLVLEGTERKAAHYWAAYENRDESKRQIAVIKYPDRYSLKDDGDRIKEAQELSSLMYAVPGQTVKRELSKNIVTVLLSHKIDTDQLSAIFDEIDTAEYTTSDPETIIRAHEAGIVGDETASKAIGFDEDEYIQAREDHVSRATRVLEAQAEVGLKAKIAEAQAAAAGEFGPVGGGEEDDQLGVDRAGARGVDDLALERDEGKQEREEANDTTLSDTNKKPVRGPGKSLNKGDE
jgi:hypothetical protein